MVMTSTTHSTVISRLSRKSAEVDPVIAVAVEPVDAKRINAQTTPKRRDRESVAVERRTVTEIGMAFGTAKSNVPTIRIKQSLGSVVVAYPREHATEILRD